MPLRQRVFYNIDTYLFYLLYFTTVFGSTVHCTQLLFRTAEMYTVLCDTTNLSIPNEIAILLLTGGTLSFTNLVG